MSIIKKEVKMGVSLANTIIKGGETLKSLGNGLGVGVELVKMETAFSRFLKGIRFKR